MKSSIRNKKGFTIVELVIVIAVIAILAAVLIPTFANLVEKANQSADIQAVKQMNTALAMAEAESKPQNLQEALKALKANGIDGDSYEALSDGHKFVWAQEQNRVFYIDSDNKVEYPEEYKTVEYGYGKWVELTGEMAADDTWLTADNAGTEVTEYTANGEKLTGNYTKYTVSTAEQLISFARKVRDSEDKGADMIIELKEGATIDMLGAEWECIPEFKGIFNGNGATVKNLAITDKTPAFEGELPSWTNNAYKPYAFITCYSGAYFGNVTLDVCIDFGSDVTSQNHLVAGALGYVGAIDKDSSVIVDNVTVKGSIRAPFRAAGIVGYVGGKADERMNGTVTIKNCTNYASVTSYLCLSSYNTAAGILSTTNQLTQTGKLVITCCTNNGTIYGSDVAGIMANCFAAYTFGSKNSRNEDNPCGTVEITACTNTGNITAAHSHDKKELSMTQPTDQACTLAADIVAPYDKQLRLYVHNNTSKGEVNVVTTDCTNSISNKCGDDAFNGMYTASAPTN